MNSNLNHKLNFDKLKKYIDSKNFKNIAIQFDFGYSNNK